MGVYTNIFWPNTPFCFVCQVLLNFFALFFVFVVICFDILTETLSSDGIILENFEFTFICDYIVANFYDWYLVI